MIDVREEIPERPIHILITWVISDLYPGLTVGFTIQSWGCGRSTEALLCSDVNIFVDASVRMYMRIFLRAKEITPRNPS